MTPPSVTAVICTRGRPVGFRQALASVVADVSSALASGAVRDAEIVVVDQDPAPDPGGVADAPRVLVRRIGPESAGRSGLSRARNAALRAARGELILFTDDDCEVAPRWCETWCRAMTEHPEAGVGFGVVRAGPRPPGGPELATIATFEPESEGALTRAVFRRGPSAIGIGANLAVRAAALTSVGYFDERLGAGTDFPAAEEFDLAYRTARRGPLLLHTRAAVVTHHGWRYGGAARGLTMGYQRGIGAMWGKHVRAGDRYALGCTLVWGGQLVRKVLRPSLHGPRGVRDLRAFVNGFAAARRS